MPDNEKKSFILYHDSFSIFSELTDEEAGKLIKAIFEYECSGIIPDLDKLLKMAFLPIKNRLDSNREKYERIRERRQEAGKQGGRPKKQDVSEKSKKSKCFSEKAKKPDTVTDTVTDNIHPPPTSKGVTEASDKKELQERFDRFWAVYPKKTAKQGALSAWQKLKPDNELTEKILLALERQKKSVQWQRDNGQYIPYPASWLNGRRWEDESVDVLSACAKQVQGQKNGHSYNLDALVQNAINTVPKIKGNKNE